MCYFAIVAPCLSKFRSSSLDIPSDSTNIEERFPRMHKLILILATALRYFILAQLQQILISLRIRCPSPLLDLLLISIALDDVVERADPAACQPAISRYTPPASREKGLAFSQKSIRLIACFLFRVIDELDTLSE